MRPACVNIHIPFCRGGCVHCEGIRCGQNIGYLHRYRRALELEIAASSEDLADMDIRSVHILGDSLQLLGLGALDDLLRKLRKAIPGSENTQWVADVMPDELDEVMLHALQTRNGIHCLQLQLLSDVPGELTELHAPFTANIAAHCLSALTAHPIEGLDMVLVIGTPGQTPESLSAMLARVSAAHPRQVTLYRFHNNRLSSAQQREYAEETMWSDYISAAAACLSSAGYERAGRSLVFALPGKARQESLPEAGSWDVVGFGLGAPSAIEGMFCHNTRDFSLYVNNSTDPGKITIPEF